jgi:hypothetical protein
VTAKLNMPLDIDARRKKKHGTAQLTGVSVTANPRRARCPKEAALGRFGSVRRLDDVPFRLTNR